MVQLQAIAPVTQETRLHHELKRAQLRTVASPFKPKETFFFIIIIIFFFGGGGGGGGQSWILITASG